MIFALIMVVLIAFPVIYHCLILQRASNELPEPPVVRTMVPFIGHIIDMVRYKKNYFQRLRDQCQLPIVTLQLVSLKVYAVFSLPAIQSIQKQNESFAFEPIQAWLSVTLCGSSNEAYRILLRDIEQGNGEYGPIASSIHRALSPGESLDSMNIVLADCVRNSINSIESMTTIKLNEWLRHHITLVTTDTVYGPHNPFQSKEVESAFWAFEQAIPRLLFLPQWFSRAGIRNRKIVADAFQHYFLNGHHESASAMVKDFYAVECSYGFSLSDRSLFEVGNVIASLANTYAAVFWLLFYVFSSPSALQRIRHEVSSIITTSVDTLCGKQTTQHILDMTKVTSHCPFLVSTFKETIRLHSVDISLRQVCKDTVLDNTYCLKKGAMIIMPTISIHTDSKIWGSDALSFNYDRFLFAKSSATQKEKVSAAAFRSFGGGRTLCPGRHFATTQIMVWISMLVMRFDIEPTSGCWVKPTADKSNMANVLMGVDHDIDVQFAPRDFYNDGIWDVRMANSKAILSLAVEDLADDQKP